MGLFKLFKRKDAAGHEAAGDRYMDQGDWGQAKLAFEDALAQLKRQAPSPEGDPANETRLKRKRSQCMENLAREHFQQGRELNDAGYAQEAREYFILARELSGDPELTQEIETQLTAGEPQPFEMPEIETYAPQAPPALSPDALEDPDQYFEALISTLPDEVGEAYRSYGSNFKAGYVALNQGDFATAAEELSAALELNPAPESFIPLELATAQVNLGQGDPARELLEAFLVNHPQNLPAYRLLCEIYWDAGEYPQVEDLLRTLPEDLRHSLVYYQLQGENYMRAGDYDQAEAHYRGFLATYGANQEISLALAGALEAQGDLASARALYGDVMTQCQGCGSRSPLPVRRKFADLSVATGQRTPSILELYLALAQEDSANEPYYYRQVSALYDHLGNRAEAQRFRELAEHATGH